MYVHTICVYTNSMYVYLYAWVYVYVSFFLLPRFGEIKRIVLLSQMATHRSQWSNVFGVCVCVCVWLLWSLRLSVIALFQVIDNASTHGDWPSLSNQFARPRAPLSRRPHPPTWRFDPHQSLPHSTCTYCRRVPLSGACHASPQSTARCDHLHWPVAVASVTEHHRDHHNGPARPHNLHTHSGKVYGSIHQKLVAHKKQT